MSDTPRTDIRHCEACGQVRFPSDHWQRKLAAVIAQRDKARNDALEEAAQVCEHVLDARKNAHITYGFNAIHGCIEAIRATAIRATKECGK